MTVEPEQPSLNYLKWVTVAFVVVTVLISVAFFTWWGMRERLVFDDQPFDQVRWMALPSDKIPSCDRGDMVRDVQNRLLKRGMSKSQVTMLLGRPSWEEANQFEYELGVCLWVVHGLRLYFDAQDRLIHASILQH